MATRDPDLDSVQDMIEAEQESPFRRAGIVGRFRIVDDPRKHGVFTRFQDRLSMTGPADHPLLASEAGPPAGVLFGDFSGGIPSREGEKRV